MRTQRNKPAAKGRSNTKARLNPTSSKTLQVSPSGKKSPGTKATSRVKASPARKPSLTQANPTSTAGPQYPAPQITAHFAHAVRARAYLNYQKRGSKNGDHTGDWLLAEAEVTAERHQEPGIGAV